jgi:SAM-dependent methyltransferase
VLDYGCGIGTLAEHLLRAGARVAGLDASSDSVDRANERLRYYNGWLGAFVADAGSGARELGPFDIVTCLEVVEHLDDTALPAVLGDIRHLLKPGGTAIFTTPNNEKLEDNFIYCPFCDNVFHHVQHMRSFDRRSLSDVLIKEGFTVDFCQGVNLLLLTPGFRSTLSEQTGLSGRVGRATLNIARLAWRCQARVMSAARPAKLRWFLHPGDNLVALVRSPLLSPDD